eukprot:5248872-Pyramimonas_sp.AAC.2
MHEDPTCVLHHCFELRLLESLLESSVTLVNRLLGRKCIVKNIGGKCTSLFVQHRHQLYNKLCIVKA